MRPSLVEIFPECLRRSGQIRIRPKDWAWENDGAKILPAPANTKDLSGPGRSRGSIFLPQNFPDLALKTHAFHVALRPPVWVALRFPPRLENSVPDCFTMVGFEPFELPLFILLFHPAQFFDDGKRGQAASRPMLLRRW